MNEKEQIEKMARDICHSRTCKIRKNAGSCYKYCNAYIYAFRAYNAGYRKESDVVDDIIRLITEQSQEAKYNAFKEVRMDELAELTIKILKKYKGE